MTYHVRYLVHLSDIERTKSFPTMTERMIFVISIAPYAVVRAEWEEA